MFRYIAVGSILYNMALSHLNLNVIPRKQVGILQNVMHEKVMEKLYVYGNESCIFIYY